MLKLIRRRLFKGLHNVVDIFVHCRPVRAVYAGAHNKHQSSAQTFYSDLPFEYLYFVS